MEHTVIIWTKWKDDEGKWKFSIEGREKITTTDVEALALDKWKENHTEGEREHFAELDGTKF